MRTVFLMPVYLLVVLASVGCFGGSGTPATRMDERGLGNPASELYAPGNRPVVAYSFELPALDGASEGETVTLAEHAGDPTLLVFWADWCGFCRHELPAVETLYQSCFRPNGIDMLGVVVEHSDSLPDAIGSAAAFAEGHGFTFESGFDYDDRVSTRYLPWIGTPSYVFVDADGRVAGVSVGARGVSLLRNSMAVLAREKDPEADLSGC